MECKEVGGMERSMKRRDFLKRSAAGLGTLLWARSSFSAQPSLSPVAPRTLGKTGITVSRLGFGTGTKGWDRSSNQTRLGQEAFTAMVRRAYERGVTFYDLADLYGSHPYLRRAFQGIPREKIVLQTKIWWRWGRNTREILDRFRQELDTDYLDIVLLHCVTEANWPESLKPMMEDLAEAKAKGILRAHGVSCHGLPPLQRVPDLDWVEVDLARINHRGAKMDAPPEEVVPLLRRMKEKGKGVIGMKILGEGTLKDERLASLKFVLGLDCVDAMVIGFESPEEVDDILRHMEIALQELQAEGKLA